MSDSQKWLLFIISLGIGWLIIELSTILFPFIIALAIAYLGEPLVNYLENHRRSRIVSVILVFFLFFLCFTLFLLILIPMLQQQIDVLFERLPVWITWFSETIMPRITDALGLESDTPYFTTIKTAIIQHWQKASGIITNTLTYITISSFSIINWLMNLLLIPVLTFYFLLDWHIILKSIRDLIPRRYEARTVHIAEECNLILGQFLHGQLLVMFTMSLFYIVGLSLAGISFALLLGTFSGILSFIPYVGLTVGAITSCSVAYLEHRDLFHVLMVLSVFGIAQLIEGLWLTPHLVGDKIGMHPVAVIFAILVGAKLFGFFGVLLALPTAAVLLVILRHLYMRYIKSDLYQNPN